MTIGLTRRILAEKWATDANKRRVHQWASYMTEAIRQAAAEADDLGLTPKVLDMQMKPGELKATIGTQKGDASVVGRFASGFLAYYLQNGGPNYCCFDIFPPEMPDMTLTVTIQRKDGKSPAELADDVRRELANAQMQIKYLSSELQAGRDALAECGNVLLESESIADGIAQLERGHTLVAAHQNKLLVQQNNNLIHENNRMRNWLRRIRDKSLHQDAATVVEWASCALEGDDCNGDAS